MAFQHASRSLTIACLALGAFVGLPADASAQTSACGKSPASFAHCDSNARNFRTVLVAVHGWNGDCASTFGTLNSSIFAIMKDRFYDMDCFEYDSKKVRLDDNVELLRKRLVDLHAKGYRQAILLTHSTGGVMALKLFSQMFVDQQKLPSPQKTAPIQGGSENDLTIRAVHAYATPINGLRAWISWAGRVPRWTTSPETLPELEAGSAYLTKLKRDLKTLADLMGSADARDRARLKVRINFYQGQGSDLVVHTIDEVAGHSEGWWPYAATLVNTESGHSYNIGNSGEVGLPNYPARLLELSALLELNLLPRLDEVFPKDVPSVSPTLEKRQFATVDGIAGYAERQLRSAEETMVEFLRRIVTDALPRSPNVDVHIMDRFAKSIEDATLREMSVELARFCERVIHKVFKGYETGKDLSLTRFGEGRSDVAKKIVEVMDKILSEVVAYLKKNPDMISTALPYSGSIDVFKATVLGIQTKVLNSRYDDARSLALTRINNSIPQFTSNEIRMAEFDKSINQFSMAKYKVWDAKDRSLVSKIYGDMLSKEPTLSDPTYAFLTQPIRWLNADKPLWTAVLDDKTVETVIFKRNPAAQPSTAKLDFLTSVIREAGASGNALPTTRLAVGEANQMIFEAPTADLKVDWQRKFIEAGRASRYPSIRDKVEQASRFNVQQ